MRTRPLSVIYCLLLFMMTLTGCKKSHHVEIHRFSYADSIQFTDKRKEYDLKLMSEVNLSLLVTSAQDIREQKIVKMINSFIVDQLTDGYANQQGDTLVRNIVINYLDEMRQTVESRFMDEQEFTFNEEDDSIMNINDEITCTFFNNIESECHFGLGDSIVCFTGNTTCYLGGAHPGEESFAYSFSLLNGNIIRLANILKKDCKIEMLNRIKRKLMDINKVSTEEELQGLGFKDIFVSPYILLEKDNITFHYKNYTIAPFYLGAINIRFNYEEIADILNIET